MWSATILHARVGPGVIKITSSHWNVNSSIIFGCFGLFLVHGSLFRWWSLTLWQWVVEDKRPFAPNAAWTSYVKSEYLEVSLVASYDAMAIYGCYALPIRDTMGHWSEIQSFSQQDGLDCPRAEGLGISHADLRGYLPGRAQPKKPLDGELAREVNCYSICTICLQLASSDVTGEVQFYVIVAWFCMVLHGFACLIGWYWLILVGWEMFFGHLTFRHFDAHISHISLVPRRWNWLRTKFRCDAHRTRPAQWCGEWLRSPAVACKVNQGETCGTMWDCWKDEGLFVSFYGLEMLWIQDFLQEFASL